MQTQNPGIYNGSMNDCLFCKLAKDPSAVIWQNGTHVAIKDIHPKAKTHLLVLPKAHIGSLDDLDTASGAAALLHSVQQVAAHLGVSGAYRVQINVGRDGGQEIDHLHVHLLSDK